MNDCKWAKTCCYDVCAPDYCPEYEEAVLTNADRIRSMTDEELIAEFVLEDKCPPKRFSSRLCDGFDSCKECWLDWLKQPAEVE